MDALYRKKEEIIQRGTKLQTEHKDTVLNNYNLNAVVGKLIN